MNARFVQLKRSWRARLDRWWKGHLQPNDQLTLTQRNIYVLPNRVGLMMLFTVLVLLIGAINYQLNLGYLLTFLLAGSASMALFMGHANLRGLQLNMHQIEEAFAGGMSHVHLEVVNPSKKQRFSLQIHENLSTDKQIVDVGAGARTTLSLSIAAKQRGLHELPLIRIHSGFPIGAFRIWSLWRPATQALVYPSAEHNPPPLPVGQPLSGQGAPSATQGVGEFDGVRAYRPGDPLKIVLWKKFAKSDELVSRDSQSTDRRQLWLDWQACAPLEPEARLSRLTAWVLQADRLGLSYGLRLPQHEIAPDSGLNHRHRCLKVLAQW